MTYLSLSYVVCLLFSWVGYIFACCLAVTIAAQSGAASGLGLSLIIKTIFVEVSSCSAQLNSG